MTMDEHPASPGLAPETFVVEQTLPRQRYDSFLHERYPCVSRGAIQRLIAEGQVRVDGDRFKPSRHPSAGDRVSVTWPEAQPSRALPEDIPLEILHEDEAIVVLNKPPGLVVHPAAGNEEHTLVNALLHHCAGQLSGIGGVARPGIVHRLDKDTSGCMVVAKHDAAHLALALQFANRTVSKIYHAVVCGTIPRLQGEIDADIARHPNHRKRMAVTPGRGRSARTSYAVLERLREATLVQALLHTGRTHQIRVHFQHLGFPLVGDTTYGNRPNKRLTEITGYLAPRQLLHAAHLEFDHPVTGRRLSFETNWPLDFQEALAALRGEPPAVKRS